ncbi:MAG: sel1 repeat family protein [Hyphomicrobiales bacterium]|nr:sel1 repeat family protein [Hyphomicrobiales bacterium]
MKRFPMAAVLALGILFTATAAAPADFDDAAVAYVTGDYDTAFREFVELANQGHVGSQTVLGTMYNAGQGTAPDKMKAYMWTLLAARKGDRDARHNLRAFGRRMTPVEIGQAELMAKAWLERRGR